MKNLILVVLTFFGLCFSVYLLRITHNDIWFFSFVVFFILFCLKLADSIDEIRPSGDDLLPVAVHVIAVLLFLYGIFASALAWKDPDSTFIQLVSIPIILWLSPYIALALFIGPQVIILKGFELVKILIQKLKRG